MLYVYFFCDLCDLYVFSMNLYDSLWFYVILCDLHDFLWIFYVMFSDVMSFSGVPENWMVADMIPQWTTGQRVPMISRAWPSHLRGFLSLPLSGRIWAPGLMKWLKPQLGYHWGSNDPEMLHDSWFTTILQPQVCTKTAGEHCAWYRHGHWVALNRGIPTDVTTGMPQVTCSPFLIFLLVRVFLEAAELISLAGTVRFTSRCGVICFTPSYLLNRCCISLVNSPFLIKSSLHIEGHLWTMWISQDY